MKAIFGLLGAMSLALTLTQAHAQAVSASGNSGTTCTQSGTTLVCTTTTTLSLPSGTNLSGMSLPQSIATGPACTSLSVSPAVLSSGVATPVALTVTGCPTSSAYTYSWGSPVTQVNAASTSYTAVLSASTPSLSFSVQVCFQANPSACSTYTASVIVSAPIPALSGCFVSASATSVTVGASPVLSASCSSGTGAGSGVSYQWSKNSNAIAGAVSSSYTLSASSDTATVGTNTYSVQINNSLPSNASASASITTTAAVAAPTDYCSGTPVRLTINAAEPYRKIYTSDYVGTFTAGNDFVIQFDVTSADSTASRFLAGIEFADFGASRGGRYATFSQNKCDYTSTAQWITPYYSGTKLAVNAGRATVVLGPDTRSADVRLTPGRWYLNIQNVVGACPSNISCHAVVEWAN